MHYGYSFATNVVYRLFLLSVFVDFQFTVFLELISFCLILRIEGKNNKTEELVSLWL